MDNPDYEGYLISLNEVLVQLAREAKFDKDESIGSEGENFKTGYLAAFHRVITLMQQQSEFYDVSLMKIGLDEIDENDLL